MNSELLDFVRRALEKGIPVSEVRQTLAQAGWAEAEIAAATDAFAPVHFPIPVPKPKPNLSARETFVHLVLFTSLYLTAIYLGAIAFELIDRLLPDPLAARVVRISNDAIRFDISALIVAFPVFVVTFRHVEQQIARDGSKRGSRPRKWLTYLTLFVAAVTLIGDVVALVYNVLGGEYAVRFLLKVATVAIVAGGAFVYFLGEMRREERA